MALSNTTVSTTYSCNGVTTSFAIAFSYQVATQVTVERITIADSTVTAWTNGVEYTISGSNVVAGTAPSSSYQLRVRRTTPLTQAAAYDATGPFLAATHEAALDKIVMMIQELDRRLDILEA